MIVTNRQKRIMQILLENEDGISLAEVEKGWKPAGGPFTGNLACCARNWQNQT